MPVDVRATFLVEQEFDFFDLKDNKPDTIMRAILAGDGIKASPDLIIQVVKVRSSPSVPDEEPAGAR